MPPPPMPPMPPPPMPPPPMPPYPPPLPPYPPPPDEAMPMLLLELALAILLKPAAIDPAIEAAAAAILDGSAAFCWKLGLPKPCIEPVE